MQHLMLLHRACRSCIVASGQMRKRAHLSSWLLVSRQVQSRVVLVLQPFTTALRASSTGVQHAVRLHCIVKGIVSVP